MDRITNLINNPRVRNITATHNLLKGSARHGSSLQPDRNLGSTVAATFNKKDKGLQGPNPGDFSQYGTTGWPIYAERQMGHGAIVVGKRGKPLKKRNGVQQFMGILPTTEG